tara:strand:+ start:340 stop:957 length:618 start_codon:yes stop_codon:yes gene_type:complete
MKKIKLFFWAYPILALLYTIFFISTGSEFGDWSIKRSGFKTLPVKTFLNIDKTKEISQNDFFDLIERNYKKKIEIVSIGIYEKRNKTILYVWTSLPEDNGPFSFLKRAPSRKVIYDSPLNKFEWLLVSKIIYVYKEDKYYENQYYSADNLLIWRNNDYKLNLWKINIEIDTLIYSYLTVFGFFAFIHLILWLDYRKYLKARNRRI